MVPMIETLQSSSLYSNGNNVKFKDISANYYWLLIEPLESFFFEK